MRRQCPDNNCHNYWRCEWVQGNCKIKPDGLCSNSGDCPNKFLCATFPDSKLSANSSKSGYCIPGIILDKFIQNNGNPLQPDDECSPAPQGGQKCSGLNGIYYVDN
ncbi:hypothetical protein niasHT_029781 [Heterodera trifolii]|uniref:Uncharacterized protein n=1 Tax=Heterodera trifolii TaxID=157864 RepID=A0ABD2KHJ3_9BILA